MQFRSGDEAKTFHQGQDRTSAADTAPKLDCSQVYIAADHPTAKIHVRRVVACFMQVLSRAVDSYFYPTVQAYLSQMPYMLRINYLRNTKHVSDQSGCNHICQIKSQANVKVIRHERGLSQCSRKSFARPWSHLALCRRPKKSRSSDHKCSLWPCAHPAPRRPAAK
jgi:hypothetical protein